MSTGCTWMWGMLSLSFIPVCGFMWHVYMHACLHWCLLFTNINHCHTVLRLQQLSSRRDQQTPKLMTQPHCLQNLNYQLHNTLKWMSMLCCGIVFHYTFHSRAVLWRCLHFIMQRRISDTAIWTVGKGRAVWGGKQGTGTWCISCFTPWAKCYTQEQSNTNGACTQHACTACVYVFLHRTYTRMHLVSTVLVYINSKMLVPKACHLCNSTAVYMYIL